MKTYITAEQAISILPVRDSIHTFINVSCGLCGADWSREDIIDKLNKSDKIELTGETAKSMGHGIVAYNDTAKHQDDLLFIETDAERLRQMEDSLTDNHAGERGVYTACPKGITNTALTLNELRECCETCTPVWVCRDDKTPIFREQIYCGAVLDSIMAFGAGYGEQHIQAIYGRNLTLAEDDYGKTWLAYRTKPEDNDNAE